MPKYSVEITSRQSPVSPESHMMGELFDVIHRVHMEDDADIGNGLDISVYSDNKRIVATQEYFANASVVNNQSEAGRKRFRYNVQSVAQEGVFGTFFHTKIKKMIPSSGLFEYLGQQMHVMARPGIDAEFTVGLGANSNGW